jgi:hypothetical protein
MEQLKIIWISRRGIYVKLFELKENSWFWLFEKSKYLRIAPRRKKIRKKNGINK